MNNNNNSIDLYNSVFNNIVLKRIIFNHLNIYNVLLPITIQFKSLDEWQQFENKQYLNRIELWQNYYKELTDPLPQNIKQVTIKSLPPPEYSSHVVSLLNNVDSINVLSEFRIIDFSSSFINSINSGSSTDSLSKLNKLIVYVGKQLPPNAIPQSITDLKINNLHKIKILKDALPFNLKKLECFNKIDSLEGGLPDSLAHVSLSYSSKAIMDQLSLSNSLVSLELLDHTVVVNSRIKFPNSLTHLVVVCKSFHALLPNNLKDLVLTIGKYDRVIQFPSTLENIEIWIDDNVLQQDIFQYGYSVPPNLKNLLYPCSRLIGKDGHSILPDKIEKLVFIFGSFNNVLKVNQLPSSLTILELISTYNQVIDINVLPSNLKTLKLGSCYSKKINPLAIPQSLKLLHIENSKYRHSIQLTPTHPFTMISNNNLNLYYDASNTQLRVLRLPDYFNSPLSTLQLQDKCNLEHLYLGLYFKHPIQLSDLPIQNNIKTLELSNDYYQTIHLEYFPNLETIILSSSSAIPIITTTTYTTPIDDNNNNNNRDNTIQYNNYKLKNIIVPSPNYHRQFIKQLDSNFYQFIKKE